MAVKHPRSGKDKHSYIQFYPADWLGGTARMTRLIKSVYFDVCLYNWDKAQAVPEAELMLMLDDLGQQGEQIINVLVKAEKLIRNQDGSVYNERAMAEAIRALDLWKRKSGGGKKGAKTTNGDGSGDGTPDGNGDESGAGVTLQNQNQNQNQNQKEIGGGIPPLVGEADEEEEKPDDPEPEKPRKSYDTAAIMSAWNEMARHTKLAQVVKMTEERRKKTRARIEEMGEAAILEAIALVPERPFLMGENDRRWKADYDFIVRPNSVAKILEGGAFMGGGKGSGWVDA